MPKTITIDVLRQITNDSISIYDALRRAHTLTEESKRILGMAEDLLRQAGLAYLSAIPVSKTTHASNASSAREEMVSAYISIQQSYADLKDALYCLAKAHIDAKSWDDARAAMEALLKIDAEYRDVANMLRQSLLDQAKALFEQEKWDEGRAILKQRPADKEMRLVYLSSFLDEDASINGVRNLQREEPRISNLPSYQAFVSHGAALPAFVNVPLPHRPSTPYHYGVSDANYDARKREYDREMIEYNAEMRRYNAAMDRMFYAQNEYFNSLNALRAELSSLI